MRGNLLDRSLVIRFYAPRSFTGEDMAELHVTGGRAVLSGVLGTLGAISGLRAAEPGEFAWRAFENGKLDLSEVEGIAELVISETAAQRRQALRVAEGQLSKVAESIRATIIRAMSMLEAELDFSDSEEISTQSVAATLELIEVALDMVSEMIRGASVAERLRDGLTVVICGAPNVGKSSFINALAKRDVSIVTDRPGTTRDLIEVVLELDGYPVRFIDTAGIRETEDIVERIGVERAEKAAAVSDVMLWLFDSSSTIPAAFTAGEQVIYVRTKSDLANVGDACERLDEVAVSAKTGSGIARFLERMTSIAKVHFGETDTVSIITERQNSAFLATEAALRRARHENAGALELLAEDLRIAARAMGRISGRVDVEDVLGDIFSRLCIGK